MVVVEAPVGKNIIKVDASWYTGGVKIYYNNSLIATKKFSIFGYTKQFIIERGGKAFIYEVQVKFPGGTMPMKGLPLKPRIKIFQILKDEEELREVIRIPLFSFPK